MTTPTRRQRHRVWFRSHRHGQAEDTRLGVDVHLPVGTPVEEIVSAARAKHDAPLDAILWVAESIELHRRDGSVQKEIRIDTQPKGRTRMSEESGAGGSWNVETDGERLVPGLYTSLVPVEGEGKVIDHWITEPERSTIVLALAHENTPAAVEAIEHLQAKGWEIPRWIRNDLDRYGKIAGWNAPGGFTTYTQLRDFLDRYTDSLGTIQGDPATIAAEAVAAGFVAKDEQHDRQIDDPVERDFEVRLEYPDGSKTTVHVDAATGEEAEARAIEGEPAGTVPHAYGTGELDGDDTAGTPDHNLRVGGKAWVGPVDGSEKSREFPDEAAAEAYLHGEVMARDPEGVAAGRYFLDVDRGEA